MNSLRPCANPFCAYLLVGRVLYCCGPCSLAHSKDSTCHDDGPLGHSPVCSRRAASTEELAW